MATQPRYNFNTGGIVNPFAQLAEVVGGVGDRLAKREALTRAEAQQQIENARQQELMNMQRTQQEAERARQSKLLEFAQAEADRKAAEDLAAGFAVGITPNKVLTQKGTGATAGVTGNEAEVAAAAKRAADMAALEKEMLAGAQMPVQQAATAQRQATPLSTGEKIGAGIGSILTALPRTMYQNVVQPAQGSSTLRGFFSTQLTDDKLLPTYKSAAIDALRPVAADKASTPKLTDEQWKELGDKYVSLYEQGGKEIPALRPTVAGKPGTEDKYEFKAPKREDVLKGLVSQFKELERREPTTAERGALGRRATALYDQAQDRADKQRLYELQYRGKQEESAYEKALGKGLAELELQRLGLGSTTNGQFGDLLSKIEASKWIGKDRSDALEALQYAQTLGAKSPDITDALKIATEDGDFNLDLFYDRLQLPKP